MTAISGVTPLASDVEPDGKGHPVVACWTGHIDRAASTGHSRGRAPERSARTSPTALAATLARSAAARAFQRPRAPDRGPGDGGQAATAIPETERSLVMNVLDFGDTTVYDVMVPLSEVTALPDDATIEEAVGEIVDKQHTRIPIYRERVDPIVGVLHAFDALSAEAAGKKGTIADIARPPIFVPEPKPTVDLLVELQRAGQQLAVVVDEYDGATGVCTVEDILEEIVGEIEDEYDRSPSPIRLEGPGLWRVLAKTALGTRAIAPPAGV